MNPLFNPYVGMNTAIPSLINNTIYIKRTEVPFYSDRLNKRIQIHSYLSRLVEYLLSKDEKKIDYALNSLLTKSYQEKLIFSISIEKDFKEDSIFQLPSILDSLLNTIVLLKNDQDDDNNQFKLIINNDMILISKIVAILRNSILQKPNDQYLANNPTALLALLEIAHSYLTFRKSLSTKQNSYDSNVFNPFDTFNNNNNNNERVNTNTGLYNSINQLNPNTTKYIIEIISKIIQHLTLQQPKPIIITSPTTSDDTNTNTNTDNNNSNNTNTTTTTIDNSTETDNEELLINNLNENNIFIKDQLKEICFGTNKFSVLKKLPVKVLTKKLLSILEMSIYCFDDDTELLACIETLDYLCKSKRNRFALDEFILKPIYDQFIINDPITTTTTTTTNNENTTTTTPITETFTINNPKEVFDKHPNLISRIIELLGHSNQSIQLLSIQILSTLAKSSQKLRITICHYPGLIRHLVNLLTHKPTGENADISKKAASLISRLSKESYNLPILLPFEITLAQIALTDNPHSDIITNILVRFEIKQQQQLQQQQQQTLQQQ